MFLKAQLLVLAFSLCMYSPNIFRTIVCTELSCVRLMGNNSPKMSKHLHFTDGLVSVKCYKWKMKNLLWLYSHHWPVIPVRTSLACWINFKWRLKLEGCNFPKRNNVDNPWLSTLWEVSSFNRRIVSSMMSCINCE